MAQENIKDTDGLVVVKDTEDGIKSIKLTDTPQDEPTLPPSRRFINSFDLNNARLTCVNDMVMLPDQCILVTEACFKKVWKFSKDGKVVQDLDFDSEPFGLCVLQDDLVAVSLPYSTDIVILSCSDLSEKGRISFSKKYYGLASDNNERIFALYRDGTMCVDIISKNYPESPYEICHVVKMPSSLYICDEYRLRALPSGNVLVINPGSILNVSCIDQNGTMAFSYDGELDNKLSSVGDIAVCVDFICIADKGTNKVHRIKHEGSFVDIPLASNDGILNPKKIFLNAKGDVLAVLSKSGNNHKIQLFSTT